MASIPINQLSKEVIERLTNYSEEVAQKVKDVVEEVAKGTNDEIKAHANFSGKATGKYVKAFSLKTTYEDQFEKRVTWYVKNPHYRLTHLLEFGHVTRDGKKRTRTYPHTIYGYRYAKNNLEKEIKGAIENVK